MSNIKMKLVALAISQKMFHEWTIISIVDIPILTLIFSKTKESFYLPENL